MELQEILQQVQAGALSVSDAAVKLKMQPFTDLGFAKPDHHRRLRQGAAEVIYGAGKTPAQIAAIAAELRKDENRPILVTRLGCEAARDVQAILPMQYFEEGRVGLFGSMPAPDGDGTVAILTAGTSDMSVGEEAALTCEALGSRVLRLYDVGVAGLHRLMAHMEDLMHARVIVAIAGMEGALPSVVGGLVDCPVIAVPTSVGYGASFGGVTALLAMLNSCASGISVVNIDNGFGAGYLANMINHLGGRT